MQRKFLTFAFFAAGSSLTTACERTDTPVSPVIPLSPEVVTIRIATQGTNPDLDGYVLTWDGNLGKIVGLQDSVAVTGLSTGQHTVRLAGVAGNCKIAGDNPVRFDLSADSEAPISVSFSISCSEIPVCTACWDY
jgi:hypothetical protein